MTLLTGFFADTGLKPIVKNTANISSILPYVPKFYDIGLNVVPAFYASKQAYRWKGLQYQRIPENLLPLFFAGNVNIAVICGRLSGNLAVIDCENEAAFMRTLEKLNNAGIGIFAVRSGGPGNGGHFYIRCKQGEMKSIGLGIIAPDVEIRGRGAYVLGPGSIHPDTGAAYETFPGNTTEAPPELNYSTIQAIWPDVTLARAGSTHTGGQESRQQNNTHLSPGENIRATLQAEYMPGNHHNAIRTAMLQAHSAGYTFPQFKAEFGSYIDSWQNARPGEIVALWNDTSRKADANRGQGVSGGLARATAFLGGYEWSGRTGATDRAVFKACIERARCEGSTEAFRATCREVAILASISKPTAIKALHRLREAGILEVVKNDRVSGKVWAMGSRVSGYRGYAGFTTKTTPTMGNSGKGSVGSNLDLRTYAGIGKSAMYVYHALTAGRDYTVSSVANVCNLKTRQARYALKKLENYGMATRVKPGPGKPDLWQVVPMSDHELSELAAVIGVYGKTQERKEKHNQERLARALFPVIHARLNDRNQNNRRAFLQALQHHKHLLPGKFFKWYRSIKRYNRQRHQELLQQNRDTSEKEDQNPCPGCGQLPLIPGTDDLCPGCKPEPVPAVKCDDCGSGDAERVKLSFELNECVLCAECIEKRKQEHRAKYEGSYAKAYYPDKIMKSRQRCPGCGQYAFTRTEGNTCPGCRELQRERERERTRAKSLERKQKRERERVKPLPGQKSFLSS